MNRYRWEMKVRRKIKLIRTMSRHDKIKWAIYVLTVTYATLLYLKGAGLI